MKTETDVYVPKQWLLKAVAMLHQFMQGRKYSALGAHVFRWDVADSFCIFVFQIKLLFY